MDGSLTRHGTLFEQLGSLLLSGTLVQLGSLQKYGTLCHFGSLWRLGTLLPAAISFRRLCPRRIQKSRHYVRVRNFNYVNVAKVLDHERLGRVPSEMREVPDCM